MSHSIPLYIFVSKFILGATSVVPPANLAQSVERAPFKRVAVGSSPTVGIFYLTKFKCFLTANLKIA